jgi:hypothetical protein
MSTGFIAWLTNQLGFQVRTLLNHRATASPEPLWRSLAARPDVTATLESLPGRAADRPVS